MAVDLLDAVHGTPRAAAGNRRANRPALTELREARVMRVWGNGRIIHNTSFSGPAVTTSCLRRRMAARPDPGSELTIWCRHQPRQGQPRAWASTTTTTASCRCAEVRGRGRAPDARGAEGPATCRSTASPPATRPLQGQFGADSEVVTGGRRHRAGHRRHRRPEDRRRLPEEGQPERHGLISDPSWETTALFSTAGFPVGTYPCYDAENAASTTPACWPRSTAPAVHSNCCIACCHNPTGYDITGEQWTGHRFDQGATSWPSPTPVHQRLGDGIAEDGAVIGVRRCRPGTSSSDLVLENFSRCLVRRVAPCRSSAPRRKRPPHVLLAAEDRDPHQLLNHDPARRSSPPC